jgi:CarD family transcriptional regulator
MNFNSFYFRILEETVNFKIGDFAVCPGHGVGQISDIEEKIQGSEVTNFYILRLLSNGMKVMIPLDNRSGIRPLVGSEEVNKIFDLLTDHDVSLDTSTWNRRYREYMEKIKTGSLIEIADVLRSLFLLKSKKNLSFGEKKMLDQCRDLLVQEISLSEGHDRGAIVGRIDACFHN